MEQQFPQRGATVADIAKVAKCSAATVSRVLSGSSYPVSQELRQRILKAADELNYSPNLLGRMLKSSGNPFVGVVIPSLQNPYYMQVAMGIEREASGRGYAPLLLSSQRSVDLERKCIQSLIQKRVGCLMLISVDDSAQTLQQFLSVGGRACVFEANFTEQKNVINAKTDMFLAGRLAMEHLLGQGHRSIAFLTPPLGRKSRRDTLDGCRFAMANHKMPFSDKDVFTAPFEQETEDDLYEYKAGNALVDQMLQSGRGYTAVFALNDLVACGVIAGLRRHNLRIPEDIAVIGCDDIPYAAMMYPRLTTIRLSSHLLGQRAAQLMLNSLEANEPVDLVTLSVKPELVERESVHAL